MQPIETCMFELTGDLYDCLAIKVGSYIMMKSLKKEKGFSGEDLRQYDEHAVMAYRHNFRWIDMRDPEKHFNINIKRIFERFSILGFDVLDVSCVIQKGFYTERYDRKFIMFIGTKGALMDVLLCFQDFINDLPRFYG